METTLNEVDEKNTGALYLWITRNSVRCEKDQTVPIKLERSESYKRANLEVKQQILFFLTSDLVWRFGILAERPSHRADWTTPMSRQKMISFHKIQSDPSLGWQWQFIHQVKLKERNFVIAWLLLVLCTCAGCKNLQCGYGPFLGWESCYVRWWSHNIAVPWDTRHGNEELPFEQTLKSLPRLTVSMLHQTGSDTSRVERDEWKHLDKLKTSKSASRHIDRCTSCRFESDHI